LGPGTKFTIKNLRDSNKIYRICDPEKNYIIPRVVQWICETDIELFNRTKKIEVLNIAGSRESKNKGIYKKSFQFLTDILHFVFLYERYQIKIWDPKRKAKSAL
jgi:hypothetical protein